ncbi:MAG: hypothetical protein R3B49_00065 [Phycisphaerales bacterium]
MNDANGQTPPATPPRVVVVEKRRGLSAGWIVAIVLGVVVLLVVPCAGLLVGIMLPALGKARQEAFRIVSESDVRDITAGVAKYAVMYQDAIPSPGADWEALLASKGWVAPETFHPVRWSSSGPAYFLVPIGRFQDVEFPTTTPLVYEHPGLNRGGVTVGFVDGHVEFVSDEAFESMMGSLVLPDGTRYVPEYERSSP